MDQLRVVSLFCGIGGIDLGFRQAGFDIVWANEFDKEACKTYSFNFPDAPLVVGDIRKISTSQIPDCDVLAAGFPCQSFSIAGKQRGFDDERGTLFFEIERIAKHKRPPIIFLENVKNLQDHDDGKTFIKMFSSLAQFGYQVRYKVLNPVEYANIPQNRERIFIIAFLDEQMCQSYQFPSPIPLETRLTDLIDLSKEERNSFYLDKESDDYKLLRSQINDKSQMYQLHFGQVRSGKEGICRTLTASMGTLHLHKPIVYDDFGIRYLTPEECLRLQGFPKEFVFPPTIKMDSAYKQIGNSVCVPLIKELAEKIKIVLRKRRNVMNKEQVIQEIAKKLQAKLPKDWDGKAAISYMKDNGCHHWKQMEWPGFYFQFMCERILGADGFMKIPGPKYGNVEFDGFKEIPWDFKAHSVDKLRHDYGNIPTNGYLETIKAIQDYGQVCFIIAVGESEYDQDGSFKTWHDELKGGISAYEKKRIERKASSRRRKTSFELRSLLFVFVDEISIKSCGQFQTAFRNSNGVGRNPKVMININNPALKIYKVDMR